MTDAIFNVNDGDDIGALFTYPGRHGPGRWDTKVLIVQRATGGFEVAVIVDKTTGGFFRFPPCADEATLYVLLDTFQEKTFPAIGRGKLCPDVDLTIRDEVTYDEILTISHRSSLQDRLKARYPCEE